MPIQYLDLKNDLTFSRIFGERPNLLISFLYAMLPLDENRHIKSIDYPDSDSPEELEYYEKYWHNVCIEKSAISDALEKEQQKQVVLEQKIINERCQKEEARNKEKEAMRKPAKKMKKYGETTDEIIKETGLSKNDIEKL